MRFSIKLKKILGVALIALAVFFLRTNSSLAQSYAVPYQAITHYTLGMVYEFDGDYASAIEAFKMAAQYDTTSAVIYLRLGADSIRLNKLEEAKEYLKKASQLDPSDLQSNYLLALVYSSQKDFTRASAEYETILKSFVKADPTNVDVYGYLGQLYFSQKKYELAAQQYERVLSIDDKNTNAMYLLGSIYLEMNKKEKAIELFQQSIKIDPQQDGSLNSLAYLYAEDGSQLDEAEQLALRAVAIDPNNGAYLDSLGWVYFRKGDYKQALATLEKANERLKDPTIYEHLGDVYQKMDQLDAAQKYWELSLELAPDKKEVIEKLNDLKKAQASK